MSRRRDAVAAACAAAALERALPARPDVAALMAASLMHAVPSAWGRLAAGCGDITAGGGMEEAAERDAVLLLDAPAPHGADAPGGAASIAAWYSDIAAGYSDVLVFGAAAAGVAVGLGEAAAARGGDAVPRQHVTALPAPPHDEGALFEAWLAGVAMAAAVSRSPLRSRARGIAGGPWYRRVVIACGDARAAAAVAATVRASGVPCRVICPGRGGSATSSTSGTPPVSPLGGRPTAGAPPPRTQPSAPSTAAARSRSALGPRRPIHGGGGRLSRPGSPDSVGSASSDVSFASRGDLAGVVYAPVRPRSSAGLGGGGGEGRSGRGPAHTRAGALPPGGSVLLAPLPLLPPLPPTAIGRSRGGTDPWSGGSDAEGDAAARATGGGGGGGGAGAGAWGAARSTRTPPPSPRVGGAAGRAARGIRCSAAAGAATGAGLPQPLSRAGQAPRPRLPSSEDACGGPLARNLGGLAAAGDAPGFVQCALATCGGPSPPRPTAVTSAVARALGLCCPDAAPAFAVAVLEEAVALVPPAPSRSGSAASEASEAGGALAAPAPASGAGRAGTPTPVRDPCAARRGRGAPSGGSTPRSGGASVAASPAWGVAQGAWGVAQGTWGVAQGTSRAGAATSSDAGAPGEAGDAAGGALHALCAAALAALGSAGGAPLTPPLRARVGGAAARLCEGAHCGCGLGDAVRAYGGGGAPFPACAGVPWVAALAEVLQRDAPSTAAAAEAVRGGRMAAGETDGTSAGGGVPSVATRDVPVGSGGHPAEAAASVPGAAPRSAAAAAPAPRPSRGAWRCPARACVVLACVAIALALAAALWLAVLAPRVPPDTLVCARSCMRGCLAHAGGGGAGAAGHDRGLALAAWHGLEAAWAAAQVWAGA